MTRSVITLSMLTAAGVFLAPGGASAQDSGSSSRISATVPEFCEIRATPLTLVGSAGLATGSVFESCNLQDGFQVVASHRALDQRERISVSYAGHASFLNADGWSPIANRHGAKHGMRPLFIRYSGLDRPMTLNIAITLY